MHCLYCGKPLGFLKELTDGEFCSSQHRARYRKLTKVALSRLIEAQPPAPDDCAAVQQADSQVDLAPRAATMPVAEPRRPRDLGGLFREAPHAKPIAAAPRPADEPVRSTPTPSLPGFSTSTIRPALGNAAALWAKLEPAQPQASLLGLEAFPETHRLSRPVLYPEFCSGMLRQGSEPTLREARFVAPPVNVSQPQPSPIGRDDGFTRPILEFRTTVAMPVPVYVSAAHSLALAQLLPPPVTAVVPATSAPAQAGPLAFAATSVRWQESPRWKLSTIGASLFALTELEHAAPCDRHFVAPPLACSFRETARAIADVEATSWPVEVRPAVSRYTPDRLPALRSTLFQPIAFALSGVRTMEVPALNIVPMTVRTVLPRLGRDTISVLPGTQLVAIRLRETARRAAAVTEPLTAEPAIQKPVLSAEGSGIPLAAPDWSIPPAVLIPARFRAAAPAMATIIAKAEPILLAPQRPRMPLLEAMPVRQSLRQQSGVLPEVPVLNTAARPLRHALASVTPATSVLPILASVLRHGRMAKAQRTSPVVFEFEALHPRQQINVPLAYMELPLPIRLPALPHASALRIVETFEYLRPLDQPGINPLEALARLWRNTPAFIRLSTAGVSLLVLLWAAAPNAHVNQVVESQWGEVQKSISRRASVELTDDFRGGLPDWEGEGNWSRTWSFERDGYVRPGRLALYRPSTTMQDYQMEFLAQIEKRSVGWVYRAADKGNYYASKITVVKPGPLPSVALIRYPVIDGKMGPAVEIPLRVLMHNDTPYRVQITVNGEDFTTSIEGQLVDYWRDNRLKTGGVGFFSDAGERARLYWMKLSHQDDFIGKVCAYFYPNPIQTKRGN